jgi:hypothetical protein
MITKEDYLRFLSSLKDGQKALLQHYREPDEGAKDLDLRNGTWLLYLVQIEKLDGNIFSLTGEEVFVHFLLEYKRPQLVSFITGLAENSSPGNELRLVPLKEDIIPLLENGGSPAKAKSPVYQP